MRASALMTTHPVTVTTEATIADVFDLMRDLDIRHVPVVVEGRLIGIVSIGDVVKAELDQYLGEVDTLQMQVGIQS